MSTSEWGARGRLVSPYRSFVYTLNRNTSCVLDVGMKFSIPKILNNNLGHFGDPLKKER